MKKYTEEDLVSFGNYLLSPERIENIMNSPDYVEEFLAERMEFVSDADIRCWKDINKTLPKLIKSDEDFEIDSTVFTD